MRSPWAAAVLALVITAGAGVVVVRADRQVLLLWRAGPLRHLISVHPTPGISDSAHHVYRADEATYLGRPADPSESERIAWMPLDQVPALIGQGDMVSATTTSALLYLLSTG